MNLAEIFLAMQGSSEKRPDGKDNGSLKNYFEKVYPDLDFERVYASDMKKMIKWLSILDANNVEIKVREFAEEGEAVAAEEAAAPEAAAPATEEPAKAPAKKAATKAAKKEKPAAEAGEEGAEVAEKPKKKAAPKAKKAEEGAEEAPKKKAAPKKTKE